MTGSRGVGRALAGILLVFILAGAPAAQTARDGLAALPAEERRGATEAERKAVSEPQFLNRSLAGVWQWGSYRIVAAEDAFNCLPTGHCPFVLLDRHNAVAVQGIALERPSIADGDSLSWVQPDGSLVRAAPAVSR